LSDKARVGQLGESAARKAATVDWSAIYDQFEGALIGVVQEQGRNSHAPGIRFGSRPA
jgi:hypothetical protein